MYFNLIEGKVHIDLVECTLAKDHKTHQPSVSDLFNDCNCGDVMRDFTSINAPPVLKPTLYQDERKTTGLKFLVCL